MSDDYYRGFWDGFSFAIFAIAGSGLAIILLGCASVAGADTDWKITSEFCASDPALGCVDIDDVVRAAKAAKPPAPKPTCYYGFACTNDCGKFGTYARDENGCPTCRCERKKRVRVSKCVEWRSDGTVLTRGYSEPCAKWEGWVEERP